MTFDSAFANWSRFVGRYWHQREWLKPFVFDPSDDAYERVRMIVRNAMEASNG